MVANNKYVLIGAGVAGLVLLYLVVKPGAASSAGEAVGGAVVDAVEGAVVGVVNAIGERVGLPTSHETITDSVQCLRVLNEQGYFEASKACSLPAYFDACAMKEDY